jgi:predicted nucleic acid-binding protein
VSGRNDRRGLIDTSVVIALEPGECERFPLVFAISAVTLAELAGGPAAVSGEAARVRRKQLFRARRSFAALPFDVRCAAAYGRVYATVVESGRKPRGRMPDLLIAATALAHDLPLYTLNAADLRGLEGLVEIVDLSPAR